MYVSALDSTALGSAAASSATAASTTGGGQSGHVHLIDPISPAASAGAHTPRAATTSAPMAVDRNVSVAEEACVANQLYEFTMRVLRGSGCDLAACLEGAYVPTYVGASDYQAAITKAVRTITDMHFRFDEIEGQAREIPVTTPVARRARRGLFRAVRGILSRSHLCGA